MSYAFRSRAHRDVLSGKHLVKFGVDVNRTNDVLDNLFSEGG